MPMQIWPPSAAIMSCLTPWWKIFLQVPFTEHPWDVGNNLKTAVHEWLNQHPGFEIDKEIDNKLLISVAPDGYLRRKV